MRASKPKRKANASTDPEIHPKQSKKGVTTVEEQHETIVLLSSDDEAETVTCSAGCENDEAIARRMQDDEAIARRMQDDEAIARRTCIEEDEAIARRMQMQDAKELAAWQGGLASSGSQGTSKQGSTLQSEWRFMAHTATSDLSPPPEVKWQGQLATTHSHPQPLPGQTLTYRQKCKCAGACACVSEVIVARTTKFEPFKAPSFEIMQRVTAERVTAADGHTLLGVILRNFDGQKGRSLASSLEGDESIDLILTLTLTFR